MSFLSVFLFLRLNFPKRKHCFSFWFSDVYSHYIIYLSQIYNISANSTRPNFPFSRPYEYMEKNRWMTSWDTEKTDHIGVFDTGNKSYLSLKINCS